MRFRKKAFTITAVISVLTISTLLAGCGESNKSQASEAGTLQGESGTMQGEQTSQTVQSLQTQSSQTSQEDQSAQETHAALPDKNNVFGEFTSVALDGKAVDQEIFANADLTMVNLWGTFCGYCIDEMPALGELNNEYKDQGFQIVGILTDVADPASQEAKDAVSIVDTTKANYTHILLTEELYSVIAGSSVPTTIFLDKDGNKVGKIYAGARDKEKWDTIIKNMLEQVKK
ncbi:MAG: TlpA disulfide reductase family protein [Clostridium sp.]